jgi:flagellar motility protein MotE (MotC chaperone)
MALFGSRKGLEWYGKVTDAEIEISRLEELCEPIEKTLSNLEKIKYMYDDPVYRKTINESIKILESHMNKLKKDLNSLKKGLEEIKADYYD